MHFLFWGKASSIYPDEPEFVSQFPELSQQERHRVLMEQLKIERLFCLQEIEELRHLLREHDIDDTRVTGWLEHSDNTLDTLIRDREGEVGRHIHDKRFFRPWGFRRRCRNFFS
ncbi:TPA: hypothetical protein SLP15_004736 [Klebsiella aerogenes]|nr:hypothetical protein [Klebsiella aerogenes]